MPRSVRAQYVLVLILCAGCLERDVVFPNFASSTLTVAPLTLPVDSNVQTSVTLRLTSATGALSGVPISFASSPAGGAFVQPGVTDANGIAVGYMGCTVPGHFVIYATANFGNETQRLASTASVDCISGTQTPGLSDVTLTVAPDSVLADGINEVTLLVSAYDTSGAPMSGQNVSFTSNGTNVIILPSSGITDGLGQFVATAASTLVQSAAIVAHIGSLSSSVTVSFVHGSATAATLVANPNTLQVGGSSIVSATLFDAQGHTVPGEGLSLSTDGSATTFARPAGVTDSSGTFSTTITSTLAQQENIIVSSPNALATTAITFTVATVDANQSTIVINPNSVVANGVAAANIVVTARDLYGNVNPDVSLVLSASDSNTLLTPSNGNTTAAGQFMSSATSTKALNESIQAVIDGSITVAANIAFIAGSPNSTASTLTISPAAVTADGAANANAVALYVDDFGNPVAALAVNFASTGSNNTITPSSGMTSANGTLLTKMVSTKAEAKTVTATGGGASPSAQVTFVAGAPSNAHCKVTSNPNVGVAVGSNAAVTVSVADAFGNPITGQTVSLAASGSNNAFTPANGNTVAGTFTSTLTSTLAQAENIIASIGTASASGGITFVAGAPDSIQTTLTASPTTAIANNTNVIALTVTVRDTYNNFVTNALVTFASSGTLNTFSPVSGSTNSSGVVTSNMSTPTAEVKTVRANVAGNFNETVAVTFTAGPPSSPNCSITATPNTNLVAGASSNLVVSVADAFGNSIMGQTVSLTGSGGSNTFTPPNGSTVAGGTFGSTLVSTKAQSETITANIGSASASTIVTYIAGSPNSAMSTLTAAPTSVVANDTNTTHLTVSVNDAYGNAVNNVLVTFSSTGSGNTFTPLSGATLPTGILTATMASTKAETKAVNANVAGAFNETATVTFTAGPPVSGKSSLNVAPTSGILANKSATATATVTLQDQYSNLVSNWPVSISISNTANPAYSLVAKSNGSGTVAKAFTSAYAGAKKVTAHTNGFNLNAGVTFSQPSAYCANGNGAFYGLPPQLTGLSTAQYIITAQMNGDAIPDIVLADSAANQVATAVGLGNGRFGSYNTYSSGGSGTSRVSACDANNDNLMDVVAVNQTSGTTVVYYGNGLGSFSSSTSVTMSGSNMGTASVVCAALTGAPANPNRDIIAGSSSGKKIWVARNNGNTTYAAAISTTFSRAVYSLGVSDVTGDGNRDAFFVDNGGHLLVAKGLGNGSFMTPATSYAVSPNNVSLTACDLNGDGYTDLINAGSNPSGVFDALLNNGTGTFSVKSSAVPANPNVGSIACGDFDGDGNQDVVSLSYATQSLTISYGKGDGTFTQTDTYPGLGLYQNAVATGDLNQDGNTDIVVAYTDNTNSGTGVMLSTGSSGFSTYRQYTTSNNPAGLASGDLNGDGDIDLAFTAGSPPYAVGVLSNNGDGTFSGPATYSLSDTPISISFVDVNNDGALDIGVSLRSSAGGINVLLNEGNGTFYSETSYAANSQSWGVGVGDFNADGYADLVTGNRGDNTLTVLPGSSSAAYSTYSTYTLGSSGSNPAEVAVGDFNGDGNEDVAAALFAATQVGTLLGNGDGTFGNAATYSPSGSGSSGLGGLAIVDLNLDGYSDLVTTDIGGYFSTFIGNASGTFAAALHTNAGGILYTLIPADLNGDGLPDVLIARHNSGSVGVYYGNGDGTVGNEILYAVGNGPYYITVDDYNGDGRQDWAIADQDSGVVSVHLYTGCP